eukprot:11478290-Ditylum_brightwellii.AAC.1
MLTLNEKGRHIEEYKQFGDRKGIMYACASYGVHFPGSFEVKYESYTLLQLKETFGVKLEEHTKQYREEKINLADLYPFKLKNLYQLKRNGSLYHLHSELVEYDPSNPEKGKIMLCSMCSSYIEVCEEHSYCDNDDSNTEENDCLPLLSIARELDYGSSHHLHNLASLNLMERTILSAVHQYRTVVKINILSRGSHHVIKGHVISFDCNAP